LVSALKSYTTSAFPDYWLIILGGLFVGVVLFMPDGIVGLAKKLWGKYLNKEVKA
jgi:urea transport system permease protein